jgi:transposase-like protein
MARPTKCTEELVAEFVEIVCKAIAKGLPFEASIRRACRKVGIDRQTYYNWRKRAEGAEEPFLGAIDRIDDAREELHLDLSGDLLTLADSGEKSDAVKLAAIKYALDRMFPEDTPSKRVELSGRDGGPIPVTHSADPTDLAKRIAKLVARRVRGGDGPERDRGDPAGPGPDGPRGDRE